LLLMLRKRALGVRALFYNAKPDITR